MHGEGMKKKSFLIHAKLMHASKPTRRAMGRYLDLEKPRRTDSRRFCAAFFVV
jgi:hypothetical protein